MTACLFAAVFVAWKVSCRSNERLELWQEAPNRGTDCGCPAVKAESSRILCFFRNSRHWTAALDYATCCHVIRVDLHAFDGLVTKVPAFLAVLNKNYFSIKMCIVSHFLVGNSWSGWAVTVMRPNPEAGAIPMDTFDRDQLIRFHHSTVCRESDKLITSVYRRHGRPL